MLRLCGRNALNRVRYLRSTALLNYSTRAYSKTLIRGFSTAPKETKISPGVTIPTGIASGALSALTGTNIVYSIKEFVRG